MVGAVCLYLQSPVAEHGTANQVPCELSGRVFAVYPALPLPEVPRGVMIPPYECRTNCSATTSPQQTRKRSLTVVGAGHDPPGSRICQQVKTFRRIRTHAAKPAPTVARGILDAPGSRALPQPPTSRRIRKTLSALRAPPPMGRQVRPSGEATKGSPFGRAAEEARLRGRNRTCQQAKTFRRIRNRPPCASGMPRATWRVRCVIIGSPRLRNMAQQIEFPANCWEGFCGLSGVSAPGSALRGHDPSVRI